MMRYENVAIPAGMAWSSPFVKWQGSLAEVSSLDLAADVTDIFFSRQTGFPLEKMNSYGCSLIFGHPQGPTGLRSITELIEELRQRGGGTGLFTGCAAGDTGAAVVLRVDD